MTTRAEQESPWPPQRRESRLEPAVEDGDARRAFRDLRGVDVFGPYEPLLHTPDIMLVLAELGARLRRRSALPADIREMAVLMIAAHWRQRTEWRLHYEEAREAGLSQAAIGAIAAGRMPHGLGAAASAAWDAIDELIRARKCTDATFDALRRQLGGAGSMELVVLAGFYALLAGVMNAAGYELPDEM